MKPDKIYVHEGAHLGMLTLTTIPVDAPGEQEYIRKDALMELLKPEKDIGWVSVKDKLPEVGHFVLTCVSDTGTPQCVGMAILLNDGTWWDGDMKVRVDYWMEVPKLKDEKK